MAPVTADMIRTLTAFKGVNGPVVSLYLNVDGQRYIRARDAPPPPSSSRRRPSTFDVRISPRFSVQRSAFAIRHSIPTERRMTNHER